jgi:hypothetical protein
MFQHFFKCNLFLLFQSLAKKVILNIISFIAASGYHELNANKVKVRPNSIWVQGLETRNASVCAGRLQRIWSEHADPQISKEMKKSPRRNNNRKNLTYLQKRKQKGHFDWHNQYCDFASAFVILSALKKHLCFSTFWFFWPTKFCIV